MKRILLFLPLFFSFFVLSAQNEWFIPFGQNPKAVMEFLEAKEYFQAVKEDQKLHRILASIDAGRNLEYVFHNGALSAISMRYEYAVKTEAKAHIQSCLSYLEMINFGDIERQSEGSTVCYTASAKQGLFKLFVMNDKEDSEKQTLQLTCISKSYQNLVPNNAHFYQRNLKNTQEKPKALAKVSSSVPNSGADK